MAHTIYSVTYLGRVDGSKRPVLVDGVGLFAAGKPVVVDQSFAQAHGYPSAEDMVTYLWDPDWGIHTAIDKAEERERWTVEELTEEKANHLRDQVNPDKPVATATGVRDEPRDEVGAPGEGHQAKTPHSTKEVK